MNILISVMIFTTVLHNIETYRILAIFPFVGKSHMFVFNRLMKELVKEGHTVDVVSHFPMKKSIPRYNDLNVNGTIPILSGNIDMDHIISKYTTTSDIVEAILDDIGIQICKVLFNTTILQNLKFTQVKYDVLITQLWGTDCFLGFKHIFNIPVVSIISNVDLPWGSTRIGNPDSPSYIPNSFSTFTNEMNLYERFINAKDIIAAKWKHWKYYEESNIIAREFFGDSLPDLQHLAKQTNLILSNSHFTVLYPRPTVPNFIEIGGLHIDSINPLSDYFKTLVDVEEPFKGVIYFNMGTLILTETFPTSKLLELFDAFRQIPYKILWKAEKEKLPEDLSIPDNVYFEKWMPQLDLLCHSNIKLFIGHGGISGIQEAVYCGVPVLGIPIFSDQKLNIKSLEKKGVALLLKYDNIAKSALINSISELTENLKYKENAKRLSALFKDRPLSPLKTAVYWIEYVIRHNGALHLRSAAADLTWIQYYLIDIATIFIVSAIISIYLIYLLFFYIYKKYLSVRKAVIKLKAT